MPPVAPIVLARRGDAECRLLPALANRHGLITGATGTGKTVTLQRLAEGFSAIGTPVFLADVKGDLAGLSQPGRLPDRVARLLEARGLVAPAPAAFPTTFWDVFGEHGHPVRATVAAMGPLLLARMLDLNETQAGVLDIVFRIADDEGLLLLDLRDLRAMLQHVGDHARAVTLSYGNVSAATVGAIQRALLRLEAQGGDRFFGEPMLDVDDLLSTRDGFGVINVLAADRLLEAPRVYAAMLLWLLSEVFERLPEVGDPDRPRLVFFFDEAHLLFADAPRALLERVELVVRLVRSKGVGVYFVTQSPLDLPDSVLGQLGNRVQHALRAYTPRDRKAVKTVATTMRPNPALDLERAITELEVGEALASLLDAAGRPGVTARAYVLPPASRIGPITAEERRLLLAGSPLAGTYDTPVDRESAYELLRAQGGVTSRAGGAGEPGRGGSAGAEGGGRLREVLLGGTGPRGGRRQGLLEAAARSALRSVGTTVGREIVRGVLGGLFGGTRGRR